MVTASRGTGLALSRFSAAHGLAYLLERRVVGGDVHLRAPITVRRRRGGAADRVELVGHELVLDLRVVEADRQVSPPLARRDDEAAAQTLEGHVPQPRGVAPVLN